MVPTSETCLGSQCTRWGTLATSASASAWENSLYAAVRWALLWLQSRFGQYNHASHLSFPAFTAAPGSKHRTRPTFSTRDLMERSSSTASTHPQVRKTSLHSLQMPIAVSFWLCPPLTDSFMPALALEGDAGRGGQSWPPSTASASPPDWHTQLCCSWSPMFASQRGWNRQVACWASPFSALPPLFSLFLPPLWSTQHPPHFFKCICPVSVSLSPKTHSGFLWEMMFLGKRVCF